MILVAYFFILLTSNVNEIIRNLIMKKFSFAILLVGLFLGPVNYLYYSQFSGKVYGKYKIFNQTVDLKRKQGDKNYTLSNSHWNTPIYLTLSPDMNPITMVTEIRYYPLPDINEFSANYLGRLSMGDYIVWQDEFSVTKLLQQTHTKASVSLGSKGLEKRNAPVKTFSVEKSGTYKLSFFASKSPILPIASVTVKVVGEKKKANRLLIKIGVGLILLSILLFSSHTVYRKAKYGL